jgi:hypothetical protein
MARRNPLLFKQEEYQFLHRIYILKPSLSGIAKIIKDKKGLGLSEEEIMFVKKKFSEWEEKNPNGLLWMKKQ